MKPEIGLCVGGKRHKFQPRYDEQMDIDAYQAAGITKVWGEKPSEVFEAFRKKIYVCVKCGAKVER